MNEERIFGSWGQTMPMTLLTPGGNEATFPEAARVALWEGGMSTALGCSEHPGEAPQGGGVVGAEAGGGCPLLWAQRPGQGARA